jgi:hypothetical protein
MDKNSLYKKLTFSKLEGSANHSGTEIMGSKPNGGMDVCVRLSCVCDVLCEGSGLATC